MIGKTLFGGGKCLPVSDVHQSPVHRSYCVTLHFIVLGDQASMHSHEADWTQTGGCYGKARLKEVLHVPPCTNIGQHRWSCVMMCSTQLWESIVLQSEGRIILIVVTFSGYIFILTTIMTSWTWIIGSSHCAILNHSTYPCFWESLHLSAYTCTYACGIWH